MNLADTKIGKKFRNKRIGKRFYSIFAIVIIITAVGIAYLMFNMISQKSEVNSIYKVRLIGIDYLIEADRDAYQSSIAISNLLNRFYENTATRPVIKKYIGDIDENFGQIRTRFDNFARLYLGSGGERVREFAIFDSQYADLKHHTERIKKLFNNEAFKAASVIYISEYDKSFSAVRNAMDVLTGVSLKLTEKEFNSFTVSFKISMILSVIIAFAIITILILSGLFLTQTITTPINLSMIFADKIAHGDFTERILLDQKDEFGDLTVSLNKAADDLERLFSEIKTAALNVTTAVDQISEGNQDLSVRTNEQASAIEEIVATLEQATATIKQNYENTQDANKLADKTKKMADKGSTVIMDAVNSIFEINESSKQIEQIIILIDKLSTQTNMLSLNASIEAARAGEHGRGFAVVADEVRNLAQQSADAANKISDLIKQVTQKIDKGTNLANQSGESLQEIVASMEKLADIISGLTLANSEQKIGMEQINTAVQEMDTMTQQNAALVEETASTSEELSAQAMELKKMMEKFIIGEDRTVKTDK